MMRNWTISVVLALFVAALALAAKDESVEQMKARFDSTRPDDQAVLGIQIARDQLRNADKLYIAGNGEQAGAAVDDIVTYSEKARDAATQSNKHLKNVEIDVRKIADKLRDIKRTLAFEDQPSLEKAISRLEEVRTTLLKAMFANDSKDKKGKK